MAHLTRQTAIALLILLLVIVAIVLLRPRAAPTAGLSYYVSTTGSDSNPGDLSRPFRTFTKGVSVLKPGDSLLVRAGTYNETLGTNVPGGTSWSAKVLIAAYQGEPVWLAPSGSENYAHYWVIYLAKSQQQYIEFAGINLDARGVQGGMRIDADVGSNPHHIRFHDAESIGGSNGIPNEGLTGPQHFADSHHVDGLIGANEFYNLTIHGGGDPGDMYYGFYLSSNDTQLHHLKIYDVAGAAIQVYAVYAAHQNITGIVIHDCLIHDITRSGDTRTYGIALATGRGLVAFNNIIFNLGNTDPVGLRAYNDGHVLANNTVWGVNGDGIHVMPGATNTVVLNNVSWSNKTNFRNEGSGTVATTNWFSGADPGFVNAAAGDFRLRDTSPLRNSGTISTLVTTDYTGAPRPQEGVQDISAYEYTPATPPEPVPVAGTLPTQVEVLVLPATGDPATVAPIASRSTVIGTRNAATGAVTPTGQCDRTPTPDAAAPLVNPSEVEFDDPFNAGRTCKAPLPEGLPVGTGYRVVVVLVAPTCRPTTAAVTPCPSVRSPVARPAFTVGALAPPPAVATGVGVLP